MDPIYSNRATLEQERVVKEDSLHYTTVDFAKLQANSKGSTGEGEIRGLASDTMEYAQICLHSRESKEETVAGANFGH